MSLIGSRLSSDGFFSYRVHDPLRINRMNTDDIVRQIAVNGYPRAGAFESALSSHGGSRSEFSDYFAIGIAQRYLEGSLAFAVADCAINALAGWMPLEDFSESSWAVYRAFDEGEYLHPGQVAGTNEDLFTRPMLRIAMSDVFKRDCPSEVNQPH